MLAESAFIAVTRQGIGGIESRVWVNVDAIALLEAQAADSRAGGSTLHLRGVQDVTTMHVKDAVTDLVNQIPGGLVARFSARRGTPVLQECAEVFHWQSLAMC